MTLRDDYEHWARSFPRRMGEGWGEFLDALSRSEPTAITGDHSTGQSNETINVDASGGAISVTLVACPAGVKHDIKKIDSSVNAVTLVGTIDGDANFDLEVEDEAATVWYDGTEWWIR